SHAIPPFGISSHRVALATISRSRHADAVSVSLKLTNSRAARTRLPRVEAVRLRLILSRLRLPQITTAGVRGANGDAGRAVHGLPKRGRTTPPQHCRVEPAFSQVSRPLVGRFEGRFPRPFSGGP